MELTSARPTLHTFLAGSSGLWCIDKIASVTGATLPHADRLELVIGDPAPSDPSVAAQAIAWTLAGVSSNSRYVTAGETAKLRQIQAGLNRPEATRAALIPIRKSPQWWALAQDERRAIFEEQSRHNSIGMEYLPPIARQLIHCRDLNDEFDFLTWFEFAPEHADAFERLVNRLRTTAEWRFIEREVDIRLSR